MITQFQRLIHRHGRWIFLILLGVIIISFLLWNDNGMGSSRELAKSDTPTVYGKHVSARELETEKKIYRLNLQLMAGRTIDTTAAANRLLEQKSLEQMAMVEKAHRLGVVVSDAELEQEARNMISEMRRAYFKDAKSDQDAFSEFVSTVLEPRALTWPDFEASLRDSLTIRKLIQLLSSTVKITPQQLDQFSTEQLEMRTAFLVRFDLTDYMGQVKPAPEDLVRFYEMNTNTFMVSEQVRVAYVQFPPQDKNITVGDEEIKSMYEDNKAAFMKPDGTVKALKDVSDTLRQEIHRQKALEQAGQEAMDFTVKITPKPGETVPAFDVLAKQKGLIVKQTDFFNSTEVKPGIPREFTTKAFDLTSENPVSDPIPSPEGVYVLSLLEKKPPYLPPFDKVKDSVKASYEAKKALQITREAGEKARQEAISLLASGKKFDQVSSELKLRPRAMKPFNALEKSSGEPYESMAHRAALKVPAGGLSDLVPDTTGAFFVFVQSVEMPKGDEIAKFKPQAEQFLAQVNSRPLFDDFHRMVVKEALPASYAEAAVRDQN